MVCVSQTFSLSRVRGMRSPLKVVNGTSEERVDAPDKRQTSDTKKRGCAKEVLE